MYPSFVGVLSFVGGVSVLFPLFAYTFTDFWSETSYMNRYGDDSISHVFLYLNIALVVCAVVALCISMWQKADIRTDIDVPFLVALVPIALVLAMTYQGQSSFASDMNDYGYRYRENTYLTQVLVMNIVYICTILGMLWAGVKNHNKGILNVSIFFLAIYIFGKYIAFAFESRMSGALVFIAGGLLCIFGTILIEKIRRKLVGTMNTTVGTYTGAVHTEDI
jgi:type III secretory pathway component EscS